MLINKAVANVARSCAAAWKQSLPPFLPHNPQLVRAAPVSFCQQSLGLVRSLVSPRTIPYRVQNLISRRSFTDSIQFGSIIKPNIFAVVDVGGKQYKVTESDNIVTEKIIGKQAGDTVILDKVLLIGTPTETQLGQPHLQGASVEVVVEQQTLSPKVYIFKKRKRKNSRRFRGYRASVTSLRVVAIRRGPSL